MGMSIGGRRRGSIGEINITPMIDVLLVLLIIFMVMQQALIRQAIVQVPSPDDETRDDPQPGSLVLEVEPGGRFLLNRQPLEGARLREELRAVFADRTRRVLFVKGSESVSYGEVAAVVDASIQAGVEVVGLVPR